MATDKHIPGGENEQPIGDAKREVKQWVWDAVSDKAAWDATATADKLEIVRLFIKYGMLKWFS